VKRASCELSSMVLKRTRCDVWQLECRASSIRASVQSDHVLHQYMLPVFSTVFSHIVHHTVLKFSPHLNKLLPQASTCPCQYMRHSVKMNFCASLQAEPELEIWWRPETVTQRGYRQRDRHWLHSLIADCNWTEYFLYCLYVTGIVVK